MINKEASIICVVFDNRYQFEDILHIGVVHTDTEAKALIMDDILRVMEDFGGGKCIIEESRSLYDEPIIIVHTNYEDDVEHHLHYYRMHANKSNGSEV